MPRRRRRWVTRVVRAVASRKEFDFQDGIYIPTIEVLRGLKTEGFEPFMVAQGQSRIEGKAEYTKHMLRMRHAGQVQAKPEANEIILINRCYGGWEHG